MPKREDIKTILVIGSGPIVIGQACEFDYSGTQGCKALREEGYRVVLVNSNPATIMTEWATRPHYIERDRRGLEKVIAREKPECCCPRWADRRPELAVDLAERGVLAKYGVELIGAN